MISFYYEFMTLQATHLFVVPSTQAKINYTRSTDYFYDYSTSKISMKTSDRSWMKHKNVMICSERASL